MQRRELLAATALAATAGCIGGSGATSDSTPTETPTSGNPEYLGVHDDHDGPSIEDVEYNLHTACNSTVYVWFEEEPDYDKHLAVWLYKNGEQVDGVAEKMSEPEVEAGRQKLPFSYCRYEKFDGYRVGVVAE